MLNFANLYLYRMTHIENVSHILVNGITHLTSENSNPKYIAIGDRNLITTRNKFKLDNGKLLSEYIPFYFGVRTPMIYVIQKGFNMVAPTPAENIVYCVTSVQEIVDLELDFVFTDGHAVDGFSSQFDNKDIQNIDKLIDRDAINAKYWKDENDLDMKRRKEAEFLVLGDISKEAILGYFVYNQSAKIRLINLGADEKNIHIKSEFYF
jgi:ssDNA thymidine ADP-ribosyltransferase, DarT